MMMRKLLLPGAVAAAAFSLSAQPALAQTAPEGGEYDIDCVVEKTGDSLGVNLVDQFLSEEGLARKPRPFFDDLYAAVGVCVDEHSSLSDDKLADFYFDAVLMSVMLPELRSRLLALEFDLVAIDERMAANFAAGIEGENDETDEFVVSMVEDFVKKTGADADLVIYLLASYTESVKIQRAALRGLGMPY